MLGTAELSKSAQGSLHSIPPQGDPGGWAGGAGSEQFAAQSLPVPQDVSGDPRQGSGDSGSGAPSVHGRVGPLHPSARCHPGTSRCPLPEPLELRKTHTEPAVAAGTGPAWPCSRRLRVPGLRGPRLMLAAGEGGPGPGLSRAVGAGLRGGSEGRPWVAAGSHSGSRHSEPCRRRTPSRTSRLNPVSQQLPFPGLRPGTQGLASTRQTGIPWGPGKPSEV